jgi:hypothetical protein
MDIISFEAKLIDFKEIDFYSDADEELIDIEDADLDISDASDKKNATGLILSRKLYII